jgi:hypothetical protein
MRLRLRRSRTGVGSQSDEQNEPGLSKACSRCRSGARLSSRLPSPGKDGGNQMKPTFRKKRVAREGDLYPSLRRYLVGKGYVVEGPLTVDPLLCRSRCRMLT